MSIFYINEPQVGISSAANGRHFLSSSQSSASASASASGSRTLIDSTSRILPPDNTECVEVTLSSVPLRIIGERLRNISYQPCTSETVVSYGSRGSVKPLTTQNVTCETKPTTTVIPPPFQSTEIHVDNRGSASASSASSSTSSTSTPSVVSIFGNTNSTKHLNLETSVDCCETIQELEKVKKLLEEERKKRKKSDIKKKVFIGILATYAILSILGLGGYFTFKALKEKGIIQGLPGPGMPPVSNGHGLNGISGGLGFPGDDFDTQRRRNRRDKSKKSGKDAYGDSDEGTGGMGGIHSSGGLSGYGDFHTSGDGPLDYTGRRGKQSAGDSDYHRTE